ncbi:MAG: NAD(P)/FAD-dependent oxidoreductase [Lachnospiraceae bacterium]|nr:NAD(P)/FAD-dependent oxidoreductase [Lachnospiraceae bacterium]
MIKVIVVGGGAAGMMAAIAAAENGAEVTLFEKNEKLGKKIYITGKGRCNVTNDCEPEAFFENIVSNPKFLYSAYYGFDNKRLIELIENEGCKLKTERGNRVFPVSDHSSDIISAFNKRLKKLGVKIILNTKITGLIIEDNICVGVKASSHNTPPERSSNNDSKKSGEIFRADRIILATGGMSYPTTGSTGDGIDWAGSAGHKIEICRPALVPFNINEEWVKELQGLSLKNVSAKLTAGKKTIYSGFGEMLFTHFGVSGPLILSASSFYAAFMEKHKDYKEDTKLKLDLKSSLTEEQLDKRLIRDFEKYSNKLFKNSLGDLLPSKLIGVIVKLSKIDPEKPVNLITKEERNHLVSILKDLTMTVGSTRGFSEAIITHGGVNTKMINPSTMESKIISGLYFCGEMIDADALTGGFNLQIAWSTGHLAGESACC